MASEPKLKIAFYWGASCGGCDVAMLDINERILEVGALADIVLWPLAADGKYADVEALPDGSGIDITFFNGGIRNSEAEHICKLLRRKSKTLISFGACACTGGVPGLANQFDAEKLMERAYESTESTLNPDKVRPQPETVVAEGTLELPHIYDRVLPVDEVVAVDYYLPGCPPTAASVGAAIDAIASGAMPPAGSVIGLEKTLCDECPRPRKNERKVKKFFRPHEIIPDDHSCLLEQGIICCGPATRGGCKAACISANMPCRGCYGAPPGVIDQGAKMLSAAASVIDANTDDEIAAIISDIKDPLGLFYQFGLAKSLLKGSMKAVYVGAEKRKSARLRGSFSVTYRVLEEPEPAATAAADNIGLGGMLLTTNKCYSAGTRLALEINLPNDPAPLMIIGKVIESAAAGVEVYDTRLEFVAVDEFHRRSIAQTINTSGRTTK